jgi:CrcB protein
MGLVVAVALGGAVGACLRYAIVLLVGHENQGFPYATLIANVLGCVAIGILLFLIDQREFLNAHWRVFVVTGILGSLTTFSTFSYESYSLWMSGERSLAVVAVSANVLVGIAAVAFGWSAASRLS